MSGHDYGPLRTYEITWKSGHIETVQGHQVMFGSSRLEALTMLPGPLPTIPPRFTIHGEFDGFWRMVISAPEEDLISVRDVTDREQITPEVTP